MKWRLPSWIRNVRVPPAVRSLAAAAAAVVAALFLLSWFERTRPLKGWFILDLATIWFWTLVLSAACFSVGRLVVERLLPARDRTVLETVALSFPVGAVVFVLGMYVGGFAHLFNRPFAVALPALILAATARPTLQWWRERATAGHVAVRGLPLVLSVLGICLVGLLYLGAMSPDAINYDATWVHMVIPQDYAREGRIVAFPGDQVKNVPHLGAMLCTWGFIVPGLDLPQLRWMMALHIEFSVFLWTLVAIAAVARWFAEREVRATWTALMLFPGIFVYDSNMAGASDHFLAMYTAPLVLATAKTLGRFDRRAAILTGIVAGGALMSKLQALYLLTPLAVWALARAGQLLVRRARGNTDAPEPRAIAIAFAYTVGVGLAILLPHLGSNVVFYRNPMYPLMQDIFTHSTPTVRDAAFQVRNVLADWNWHPPPELGQRIKSASEMMFTFSFLPHYSFVNYMPVFGSTFTLALPLLIPIGRAWRVWLGAAIVLCTLFMWAMSYWVDRNLQTFLPVMVAVTAAILVRAWQLGWFARAGVALLVAVQLAWAVPWYFEGSGRMMGAISLLKSSTEGHAREILRGHRSQYVALGKSLPANAVVMVHNQHVMLGIDRPVILDWMGFQTIIDYRLFKTPRDLYDRLRQIGVTHVAWTQGGEAATMQAEIIFDVFAHVYGRDRQQFSELTVFPMPATPPPVEDVYKAVTIGVRGYPDGLYNVDALFRCDQMPPRFRKQGSPLKISPSPSVLLGEARVVLMASSAALDPETRERLAREFHDVPAGSGLRLLMRN